MALIWKRMDGQFVASPLNADNAVEPVTPDTPEVSDSLRLVMWNDGNRPHHVLIAGSEIADAGDVANDIRVNGQAVIGGLCVLHHQDELIVNGQRMFYSSESSPTIEEYVSEPEGTQHTPRCAICRGLIEPGQPIVRCPGCSRKYHQIAASGDTPAKLCWTYSPACRFCQHPTPLSGAALWHPDQDA